MSTLVNLLGADNIESFIILGAVIQAVLLVGLVWHALVLRDAKSARMKSIQMHEKGLRDQSQRAHKHSVARPKLMGAMEQFVQKLNVLRSREAEKVAVDLARAGIRNKEAITVYFFFRFALPFAFGGLAVIWFYVLGMGELSPLMRMLVSCAAVLVGAYAPKLYIANTAQKRREALQKGVPDALDLLVVCAEAGLSLDMALKRVSKEMMGPYPEISEELGLTAMELGFLPNRGDALANLNQRTGLPALRAVVSTLQQTERYGTPLAHSLRVLSSEFRTERMLKAEEKAAKLPATLTIPMIVFIMPALFIVLLGPALIRASEIWPDF